ncbi:M14 family metallopeptidase [uncultured Lacinutrix sp.]|uniref:M14 family metallopeptidase n=1 Tax=uncultured Lacinutrix sp. TaxID=574032 RepID=UPI00262C545B|nr:M14 family metallopeptidase [uncultured Lacinutrix sp.]
MKRYLLSSILIVFFIACSSKKEKPNVDFTTVFEKSEGTKTATYQETISFYKNLSKTYASISFDSIGITDSGKPLHVITYNSDNDFNFSQIRKTKRIILINNGIHPGESDGIDATMMLYRDIVEGKIKTPDSTVIVTIPIYNVGGSLNRNSTSRTNQNGPESYGFRGNARNFDLNRDFIKCDTENAKTFTKLFHLIQPDVFIDNHVSNGADYQYTLTHLFTQHNKLGGVLGNYLNNEMMPELEQKLKEKDWDITPYVNVYNKVPDNGFSQFMDYPRYSTGYATLFNTLGMMVETHMLKPYKQRVEGTYELMKSMIEITESNGNKISKLRIKNKKSFINSKDYVLDWQVDSEKSSTLKFKGYEGETIVSKITGKDRLKYNRSKPFTKDVIYQNYFKSSKTVSIPKAYIIPKGWHNVIKLLQLNNVTLRELKKDSTITIELYRIKKYDTRKTPYEGHYLHYNTSVESNKTSLNFSKGDYIVSTNQNAVRYLLETLEPQAPDSFFNWNFFDTILQQKEGFSAYVWEDKAKELLHNNEELKIEFETKKNKDEKFAKNWYAQLDWLHKHSENYEKAHMQYPIYRILKD